jgi:hypothetical protein
VQEGEESESQNVRKASINLPVAGVLDTEKGGFKPVEELRATFEAAGLLDPTKRWSPTAVVSTSLALSQLLT